MIRALFLLVSVLFIVVNPDAAQQPGRLRFVPSGGGAETPSFVQKDEVENATSSQQTSIQTTLPGVQAGSTLIVVCRSSSGQHLTVTSSPAATWVEDVWDEFLGWSLGILSARNVAGGSTTITIHASPADFVRVGALEYSGVADDAAEDTSSATGSSQIANAGSVTTLGTNRLLVVAVATDGDANNGVYSALDSYTLRLNAPAASDKIQAEDKVGATAGSYAGRMDTTTGNDWTAVMAAYKPGP